MPVDAKRAQAIFLAAVEATDPAARTVILDRECGDDPELRQRVEALLRAYSDPDSMLDAAPIVEAPSPESEVTQAIDSAAPQPGDAASVNDKLRDLGFLKPSTRPGSIGRIDQYEILEVIGQGGFGTVFKAFDDKLHRVVAIKVLSPAYAANGAARKRFIREARTAAAIKNEHVVAIYDVDEDAQPPYLAMEMIDGMSLQDKLDKHGPLGLKEILRIGLQMAEGLAAAHKQSLVHRDIKPANILLENGVERVKITDFGLARAVDDASVTQSGTVAGTPMYMSPEQAEGAPIDHRSDLFSLGTVLYAMCTGHPPFRATGTHAVLKRVIDASPRPIREINDDMPQWLCDIIGKLHAKKPEDRYASAKDVAEVLGARLADVQAGRAVETRADGTAKPRSSSSRRLFKWTAALLCVGAIGCAVAAAVDWLLSEPEVQSVANNTNIVFYIDDPELEIEVQAAGEEKPTYREIHGGASARSFGVNPGEWEVRGYKDHKLIRRKRFVLAPQESRKIRWDLPEEAFIPLFNGQDLTGWAMLQPSFEVKNGILKGAGLIIHDGEFENFHLRVEARLPMLSGDHGDTGIFFRCKPGVRSVTTGYSADIERSDAAEWTAALYREPRLSHTLMHRSGKLPIRPNEWFLMEVIAVGKQITVKVDGAVVADLSDSTHARGHIALHGRAATKVEFRTVEIKELSAYKDDRDRLQGRWVAEYVEFDGKQPPNFLVRDKISLTFAGNTLRATLPQPVEGTFQLDETAKPKQIDLLDGDGKGRSGIYRFDGDKLSLCLGEDDKQNRPTEFTSKGSAKRMLGVFTRAAGPEEPTYSFPQHRITIDNKGYIQGLTYGSDVKTLIAGGDALTFYDAVSGEVLHRENITAGRVGFPFSLSRDRRTVALVDKGTAIVLELPARKFPLQSKSGTVFSAAISADAKSLAYVADKVLWIHDRTTAKSQSDARHVGELSQLKYSPDGRFLLCIDSNGMPGPDKLRVLDANSRDLLAQLPVGSVSEFDISMDGKRVALVGRIDDKPGFVVLSLPDLKVIHQQVDLENHAVSVSFAPDGNHVAVGLTGAAQIWDIALKKKLVSWSPDPLTRHTMVAFSPDGKALATGSGSRIRIWDLTPQTPGWVQLFNGKDLTGWDAQKGREYWRVVDNVLSGTAPSGLILMPTVRKDYANFHLRAQARIKGPGNSGILFRGQYQAEIEATQYTGGIALNQPFKWLDEKPNTLVKPNEWFTLEIIANGPRLRTMVNGIPVADVTDATAASGEFALELNAQNGPVAAEFKNLRIKELAPTAPRTVIASTPKLRKAIDLKRRVSYLAFGADSNTLIVGGNTLTFLDTVTGDVIHEENLPDDIHAPLALSKDRKTLATSYKENVLILDLPVRKVPFQSKSGYTFSVALSPDGNTLVYAADKSLFFYDRGTRKLFEENRYHRLMSLKWSLDGNYLIGVWAKELTILNATTRELIARKPIGVMGLTDISSDSKRIAVTGMEAGKFAFFIYGMPGHRLEYKETSLDTAPVSVAFSPDGTYLALGLADGKAEIWDLVERKRVASWLPAKYEKTFPTGVAFSPDGKTLATGSNTSVQLWDLDKPDAGWTPLFNGKDLTGWKNHPDQPGDWKVVKEVLVGKGRMGLLYSERGDYADYDLRIEAKVNKGGYGGVYVRTPDFPAIRRQVFDDPKGHRVVMSAASKLEPAFNTGSLKTWTPKGHLLQAYPNETPADEWFTLEILTRGPEVFVRVNGKKTAQIGKVAEKSHEVGLKGYLVLEAAGDDTMIHIRKIEIKEIAPSP